MFTVKRLPVALLGVSIVWGLAPCLNVQAATLLDLDFNSGVDSLGNSQGDLVFNGLNGFQVTFTDDNSSGSLGGNADGVHITNLGAGNIKVGSPSDLVLGAFNTPLDASRNYHSSGIVARFNQGVELVSFLDTDDDRTTKTLFAFDENGTLIGQTLAATQVPFSIDTSMTGGNLIHSIEFDTRSGSAGGSLDGTVFTIDNFHVEGTPIASTPEPSTLLGLGTLALAGGTLLRRQRKRNA